MEFPPPLQAQAISGQMFIPAMAKRMLSGGVRKQGWNFKGPFGRHQLYHHCFFLSFTLLCVRILEFHDAPSLDFNVPVKSTSLWQWTKPRVVANSQHKHHALCPGALSVKLPLDTEHSRVLYEIVSNTRGVPGWPLAVSFLWVCEEDGNSDLVSHGAIHQADSNSLETTTTFLKG